MQVVKIAKFIYDAKSRSFVKCQYDINKTTYLNFLVILNSIYNAKFQKLIK